MSELKSIFKNGQETETDSPNDVKLIKFTRRSKTFSPNIINQKIITTGIECASSDLSPDVTCIFDDEFGTKTSISGIVFINYDVKHPNVISYKDENGHNIHKVIFDEQAVCEVLGPKGSSTMKCSDKRQHESELKQQRFGGQNIGMYGTNVANSNW